MCIFYFYNEVILWAAIVFVNKEWESQQCVLSALDDSGLTTQTVELTAHSQLCEARDGWGGKMSLGNTC